MGMQQVTEAQAHPEVVINRNSQTLEHQAVYGQRQSAHSGLTWGYYGGRWGGFSVADGTLSLTDASTNYVVVEIATGAISTSTSNTDWNNSTDYAKVYRIVTSGGVVTNNSTTADFDYRAGPGGVHGGGGGGGSGAVSSVNGQTGAVSLNAGYIGVKGADIASASTVNLSASTGEFVDITGTTTITAFGTLAAGVIRVVRFTGALTLTHNATSLILPGGANIATAAGDVATLRSLGSGNWVCASYTKANGQAVVSGGSSLSNWTEAANSSAPNATVPVVSFTATNAATNVDAALVAKGSGATLAHVPSGSAAGGNKRGTFATDWQKARGLAAQVASGNYATISGGENNTASGVHAVVAGGYGGAADGARSHIGGGFTNQSTGADSAIGGGENNATSSGATYGTIGGGRSNQVTASDATIVGGRSNTAAGQYAVASGFAAVASAEGAQAHGRNMTLDGQYSHGRGRRFNAQAMKGVDGWASGSAGDSAFTLSQRYTMLLRARTTDATATQATSDGAAASSDNRPALSNSLGASSIFFKGRVNACGTANNQTDVKSWTFEGTLRRGTSGNVALVNAVTPTVVDAGSTAGSWTVAVTADTGNQCLSVQVTGEAAKTINWAADLDVVHCTA